MQTQSTILTTYKRVLDRFISRQYCQHTSRSTQNKLLSDTHLLDNVKHTFAQ